MKLYSNYRILQYFRGVVVEECINVGLVVISSTNFEGVSFLYPKDWSRIESFAGSKDVVDTIKSVCEEYDAYSLDDFSSKRSNLRFTELKAALLTPEQLIERIAPAVFYVEPQDLCRRDLVNG